MQKKIIALAIAAAVSAPAFADNSNVTFYGKAFLNFETVSNDKALPSGVARVQSNASRLGVKGGEDLGEGLKSVYQFEVEMDADGSTGAGLGKTRNSGVGLEAGFGKVIMGIWDTPFKVAHNAIELFDNTTSFSAINLVGRANGTAKNYNSRQKNSLVYWSPEMGGFQVSAAYTADETDNTKNSLSGAATFKMDQLYVAAAMENRPVVYAGTTVVNDSATRLVAKFDAGQFWVGAMLENITVNTSATASYKQSNSELVGSMKLGASSLAVSYAKAGETNVTATGANQVSLRYGFNLSKRTELFAAYTSLSNDTAGVYGFSGGTNFGLQAGSKQKAVGLGMIHSF